MYMHEKRTVTEMIFWLVQLTSLFENEGGEKEKIKRTWVKYILKMRQTLGEFHTLYHKLRN